MILNVFYRGRGEKEFVGRLADTASSGRIYFQYDERWLSRGLELAPYYLPLATGATPVSHDNSDFRNLFGLFRDSLPDHWGEAVLNSYLESIGSKPDEISTLARLGIVGRNGLGALSYEPEQTLFDPVAASVSLIALNREAAKIGQASSSESQPAADVLRGLQAGASAGGAKPKVLVYLDESSDELSLVAQPHLTPWLVKLSSVPSGHKDSREDGRVEYAFSLMAREAGIDLPPTRLFEIEASKGSRGLFAVRRFDRSDDQHPLHVVTISALRHLHHQSPGFSYDLIADTLLQLTGDHRELDELFRRAAFNVLAGNRDDHAKNFALLMDGSGQWRQSPAYDLTPSRGPGRQGFHVAAVNGEQSPTKADLSEFADKWGITNADEILAEVEAALARWSAFAEIAGLRKPVQDRIQGEIEAQLEACGGQRW